MRRSVVGLVLTAALATRPATCVAQFGGGQPEYDAYQNYVIVEGGRDLSPTVLNIVAQSISPKLTSWPDEPSLTRVVIDDQPVALNEDARIYSLIIEYQRKLQPSDPQVRELENVARSELEAALRRVQAIGRERQARQLEQSIDELTAQQHELDAMSAKLREELADRHADSMGSETNLGQGLAEAMSQQRELQLEEAGIRARREAIERRIDELLNQTAASKEDELVKEFETLVDVRRQIHRQMVEAYKVQQGAVTQAQFAEADAQLAQARIELLKAQRDAEERAGGGALRELNNELSRLVVQAAEIQGRQKELQSMIDALRAELRQSIQAHAAAERLHQELETVRQRRSHIDARWFEKQREKAELPQSEISLRPLEAGKEKEKSTGESQ